MQYSRLRHTLSQLAISSYLTFGAASGAHAQDAEADEGADAQLHTILVTADKRASDLQRTPISITALSADDIQRADIRSVADLGQHAPSIVIQSAGAYPLNVTIRGIGYDGLQNNSSQPGVAFVQNGIYIASPLSLSASFLDLQQIEILRGPQGTVNGQNADGGALNSTTKLAELSGSEVEAEASYGSYDYIRLRAAANAPLGETVALRAAIQHEGHDGWLKAPNQPRTDRTGSLDSITARASLIWQPTERFSALLWGEYFDLDSNGLAVRNTLDPIGDQRTTGNDAELPQKTRGRIVAGTLTYDFDFATLKSLTSYQYARSDLSNSGDLLSRADALAIYGVKDYVPVYQRGAESVTQELNLSHVGGTLDWIAGVFLLRTDETQKLYETQQTTPVAIPVTPIFNPTPDQLGALFAQQLAFVSVADARRHSFAAYGQTTWHLDRRVRLTGGLRFSLDRYKSNTSTFFNPAVPLSSRFEKLTGKAVIEFEPIDRTTVYASFATGVKPGGTNLNPDALIVPTGFDHEFVRAYEIGLKSEFADRSIRLNAAGFYNDYRNYQTASEDPLPFNGGQTNIPKSHIYGLELEGIAILPEGFTFNASASFMRGKVTSDIFALDPQKAFQINRATGGPFVGDNIDRRFAAFENLDGNELPRVPNHAFTAGLVKSSQLASGTLDLFLQASYIGGYKARVFNNPLIDDVGSQFVANFNARFQPDAGSWYAEFQVSNLTNSDDVASRFPDNFEVGAVHDLITPPRQFIGRVGFRF